MQQSVANLAPQSSAITYPPTQMSASVRGFWMSEHQVVLILIYSVTLKNFFFETLKYNISSRNQHIKGEVHA